MSCTDCTYQILMQTYESTFPKNYDDVQQLEITTSKTLPPQIQTTTMLRWYQQHLEYLKVIELIIIAIITSQVYNYYYCSLND